MCLVVHLYAIFRNIPCVSEGSKRKMVDQTASDGRVSHFGVQFLRGLEVFQWLHEQKKWYLPESDSRPSSGRR